MFRLIGTRAQRLDERNKELLKRVGDWLLELWMGTENIIEEVLVPAREGKRELDVLLDSVRSEFAKVTRLDRLLGLLPGLKLHLVRGGAVTGGTRRRRTPKP